MAIRGMIANTSGSVLYVVVDDTLYQVAPNGDRTDLGVLYTRRGTVGMRIGLYQLVVVDGPNCYVYDTQTKVFTVNTSEGWLGSKTVEYIDGYFTFTQPNTQNVYVSVNEDALTIDPTHIAEAFASPDKLIGQVSVGRALLIFGEMSGEVWQNTGGANPGDAPFERNSGIYLEVGLLAPYSVGEVDNTIFWLGRDQHGAGIVYRLEGFTPRRVSTMALEQKIQKVMRNGEDVSDAVAYAYQQDGHSFYVVQIPGLPTTWCFDASSGQWHERAELVQGDYEQHRGRHHAYCFGKHLIGGENGIIYEYDPALNTNAGDVLVRDRVSPHQATKSMRRIRYNKFELDCTIGHGVAGQSEAKVMLRYSDDGGKSWENAWRHATLGAVGEHRARARFMRCGSARDRVWQVRCTDDTPFAIIEAEIEAN